MFRRIQAQWRDLTKAKPGTRFQNRYQCRKGRRGSPFLKACYMALGAVLFVTGIILMPAPGPGVLVMFVGAGMLAEESLLVAHALDAAEVKVRRLINAAVHAWKRKKSARDRRALSQSKP